MSGKLVSILYLLWACSLVSAKENVTAQEELKLAMKGLQNVPPQYANEEQGELRKEQQEMPVTEMTKMEAEKLEASNVKGMQVTGFITAGGSIFEVDDKRSVGVIEGRQNGQLLSPQPGEFICNYGSVVVYSDRPCEDVMQKQKEQKEHKEIPNKSVKPETDKQTDQKQKESVASEQIQADDTQMGTKDEQLDEEEQKPMTTKKPKSKKTKKKPKKSKKKSKKNKKKSKKSKKRPQNGAQRIRVKTKIVKKRPTQQQLQSNRRIRPRPQQQQSQRRFQNRRFAQYQANGGLFTTPNGKLYELVEVAN